MAETNSEYDGKEGFGKQIFTVVDIFPQMYRDILEKEISPREMFDKIAATDELRKLLTSHNNEIASLRTEGYKNLDVSLLYKLLRIFSSLKPTLQWGKIPDDECCLVGDDIERIHIYRNIVLHKPEAYASREDYNKFFEIFQSVGRRIDKYLGLQSCFEKKIAEMQRGSERLTRELQRSPASSTQTLVPLQEMTTPTRSIQTEMVYPTTPYTNRVPYSNYFLEMDLMVHAFSNSVQPY